MRRLALALIALFALACSSSNESKLGTLKKIDIQVDPISYTFPATPVGQTATLDVSVQHIGEEGTLELREIDWASASEEFSFEPPAVTSLEPGDEALIRVTYAPVDELADHVELEVHHNSDLKSTPQIIELRSASPKEALVIFPSTLDFGEVDSGSEARISVRVENQGTKSLALDSVAVRDDSSPDFFIDTELTSLGLPRDMAPGDDLSFDVVYQPSGGDADTGLLQLLTHGGEQETLVQMTGKEMGPDVLVVPASIDFGWVDLGDTQSVVVNVKNRGDRPLIVEALELVDEETTFVTLEGLDAESAELGVNEKLDFEVVFHPTDTFSPTPSFIARVWIKSNDQDSPELYIPVFGRVSAPNLVASPKPVDFGFVALGDTQVRALTLLNNGFGEMTVDALVLDPVGGEFAVTPDEGFGPVAATPVPAALPAGETQAIEISFTNTGGAEGEEVWGSVTVSSNDPDEGAMEIGLVARRSNVKECKPVFVPGVLDFGFVAHGYYKKMNFTLKNVGTGDCLFKQALLSDCMSMMGIEQCMPGNMSSKFKLMGMPLVPEVSVLAPGDSVFFPIRYTPPDAGWNMGMFDFQSYASMLLVRFEDVEHQTEITAPVLTEQPGVNPGDPPTEIGSANLRGTTGEACLTVLPPELDFGEVGIGCTSQLMTVKVYNTCEVPMTITDLDANLCLPEFKVKEFPPLPMTLTLTNSMEIKFIYAPQDEGPDSCGVPLYTSDQNITTFTIPLMGSGTWDMDEEDEFVQTTGQEVDILFVVDNSGSMGGDQQNLSDNFGALASKAQQWENDFHIGVVTTDMDEMNGHRGKLMGDPRYVTPSNWELFKTNVKVGDMGDATERGLFASQAALSFPLAHDTSTACSYPSECEQPDDCLEGFCGGYNRGFMRQDATLHVVYVSDEEDDSPAPLDFYIDFLKSIKGYMNPNLLKVHAVVAGVDPEGTYTDCAGEAGMRYMAVADETGGVQADLCDPNWNDKLDALGEAIFGLKTQFFLSRPADPPTIEITVNGQACVDGWTYDQDSNSVVFDEFGPCMPQPGDHISIKYGVFCYQLF